MGLVQVHNFAVRAVLEGGQTAFTEELTKRFFKFLMRAGMDLKETENGRIVSVVPLVIVSIAALQKTKTKQPKVQFAMSIGVVLALY